MQKWFSEWPKNSEGVSTHAVGQHEYAEHQAEFVANSGILPRDGAVRWSLQLQCKLVGDGPEGWACLSFANKLKVLCGVVKHLGGLHASELAVTAPPVTDTKGVHIMHRLVQLIYVWRCLWACFFVADDAVSIRPTVSSKWPRNHCPVPISAI